MNDQEIARAENALLDLADQVNRRRRLREMRIVGTPEQFIALAEHLRRVACGASA